MSWSALGALAAGRRAVRCCLVAVAALFTSATASAQVPFYFIVNDSPYDVEVYWETSFEVPGLGTLGAGPVTIAANDGGIIPVDLAEFGIRFEVDLTNSLAPAQWAAQLRHPNAAKAGGTATIRAKPRPDGLPDYLWVTATDASFVEHYTSDPFGDDPVRRVDMLGTGDCQYLKGLDSLELFANQTHDAMRSMLDPANPAYRGVLYAGDLTGYSRESEWFDFQQSVLPMDEFVYESVGNHDLYYGVDDFNVGQLALCNSGLADCSDPSVIIDDIVHRHRSCIKSAQSFEPVTEFWDDTIAPHYSWDWHDVHFVQLGLVPGNGDSLGTLTETDDFGGDPLPTHDALDFLVQDLAARVGSSGRPVVLIHHYHLHYDSFGLLESFTHAERVQYWNAIKDYNVVGIFAGHRHYSASGGLGGGNPWDSKWNTRWYDPNVWPGPPQFFQGNSTNAPPANADSIPTYVMGASRGTESESTGALSSGTFVEIRINAVNQLRVARFAMGAGTFGEQATAIPAVDGGVEITEFGDGRLYVAPFGTSPYEYGSAEHPFRSISTAQDALSTRFTDVHPDPATSWPQGATEVQFVGGGSYPGAVTLDEPATWTASGGVVRIGA